MAAWNKEDGDFKLLREVSVAEKANGKKDEEAEDDSEEGDMSE